MIIVDERELRRLGVKPSVIKEVTEDVQPSVDRNAKATFELAAAIKELASRPPTESTDVSTVLDAIYQIQNSQLDVLQLLEKKMDHRPKKFEFFIARTKDGAIHKITAKETSK